MSNQETSLLSQFIPIVFFGILTVFFAEVFSGSAPFWFMDAWGVWVVLPLYWSHALVLFTLALRSRRTTLTHLYLYGVLFGLYESWVTKVIWAGYMGQEPGLGTFLGFAVGEFLVIALFWHAIFSFIIPILMFEIVVASSNRENIIPGHLRFLKKTKKNQFGYLLAILTGSLFLAAGTSFDLIATLFAAVANCILVILFMHASRSSAEHGLSVETIKLKGTGLGVAILYILGLYLVMFFILLPERIPAIETIILTLAFYALVFLLIQAKPPEPENDLSKIDKEPLLGIADIQQYLLLFVVLGAFWCLFIGLSDIMGTLLYLGMIVIGPGLFMFSAAMIAASRLRRRKEQAS
ncbi:MAG: hypothetical protein ACFFAY_08805 [Promethearchaeota archaeon]